MRPKIGITAATNADEVRTKRYVDYVRNAGGEPVVLTPADTKPLAELKLDGLLFSGGVDFNPRRYGEELDPEVAHTVTIDEERDAFEFPLLHQAVDAGLPVLGICRGFQLLNVALGGGMVQHLDGHTNTFLPEGSERISHDVKVEPESRLGKMLGERDVTTNSWHHQGVRPDQLAPPLKANAWAPDGLVEGVEAKDGRWIVGVQFHPERLDECAPACQNIATAFVEAAAERAGLLAQR